MAVSSSRKWLSISDVADRGIARRGTGCRDGDRHRNSTVSFRESGTDDDGSANKAEFAAVGQREAGWGVRWRSSALWLASGGGRRHRGAGGRIAAQPFDAGTAARGPDTHQVKLERSRRIDDDVRLIAVVAD